MALKWISLIPFTFSLRKLRATCKRKSAISMSKCRKSVLFIRLRENKLLLRRRQFMQLNDFNKVDNMADVKTVPSYGLLYIIRAYNQKEISFDEWLRLSREWAEEIIKQHERRVA